MADTPVPGYQTFWTDTHNKLKSEYQRLMGQFSDVDAQLFKVIRDIKGMARYTPALVGESEQWSSIVNMGEEYRQNICKVLNGKNRLSTLYGTYTVALHELKAVLKPSTPAGHSKTPSQLPTRRMASKKSGGANGTAQMRLPQLQRKQHVSP
jgi:hypothetical protein